MALNSYVQSLDTNRHKADPKFNQEIATKGNVPVATVATVSYAAGLALWQAFFFISGKEVWYFPQYDMDLNPNYF